MSVLPETILQLGAGRFLRAFVDRFVQNANDEGQNVGRVVIVQSTAGARAELLQNQPEGFHVLVRGYESGQLVERVEMIQSISRALIASTDWVEVLKLAASPDLRFLVSNATEAGYSLEAGDTLASAPPKSLPGKLTQIFWARFQAQGKPLTVLPCELIERNADKLSALVATQARQWNLPAEFLTWVQEGCCWLNSLVDCIITRPSEELPLAQKDPLLVGAEPYYLWALEKPKGRPVTLFEHPAIHLVDDLSPWFLRKVRMLNGTHSAMAGKYLGRFETVLQVMDDPQASRWIRDLLYEEIVPTLAYRLEGVAEFADATIDRFRNPYLNHRLTDISLNHQDKVKVRLVPTMEEYQRLFGKPPRRIAEVVTR